MDEAKEKFFQCHDDTKSAFEELCAMVDALNVSTARHRAIMQVSFRESLHEEDAFYIKFNIRSLLNW